MVHCLPGGFFLNFTDCMKRSVTVLTRPNNSYNLKNKYYDRWRI